jgi:predicted nucleic acid-binding protein
VAGILLDTSVYISALRQGDSSILELRRSARAGDTKTRALWLSVVVLEELYVGAMDGRARKAFARLEREFERIGRLLVPGQRDWSLAGQVLYQIGRKHGFDLVGRTRMTNAALIAMSACSRGATILTKNPDDYQLIAEFRAVAWQRI